jgi:DNA-binding NarL/FixJ family response regulator
MASLQHLTHDNHRSAPAIRVLVAEDFEAFRRFFRSTLGKLPNLQIVAEVSDGLEAVRMAAELQPDLILLDIGLPTLDGIEAARHIRTQCPAARIIFVTQESDAYFVQEAFAIGAMAYVTKINARRDLLPAVNVVLEGGQFVSSGLRYQELPTQALIVRSD